VPTSCRTRDGLSVKMVPEWQRWQSSDTKSARPRTPASVSVPSAFRNGLGGMRSSDVT
jgi:hypothetical protein